MGVKQAVDDFNGRVADRVTAMVGSMWCAYVFCLLALLSLPAVLSQFGSFKNTFPHWLIKPSIIAFVAWIAQTFLQLVLLSVIMVGQDRHAKALESHDQKLDRLHEKHDKLAKHLVK